MGRTVAYLRGPDVTRFMEELEELLEELRQELPGCSERDGGEKAEEILWRMLVRSPVGLSIGAKLSKQAIQEFRAEAPSVFWRIKHTVEMMNELFS